MPPYLKKLVRAKRSRKNSLRGANVIFVEDVSGESPSIGSSFSLHNIETRLQESSLVPVQSTIQSCGATGGVSIPSSSTANNTLMIPSRPLPSNVLDSSSDVNGHPSNNSGLGSLQPLSNNVIKDVVTIPLELPKTFTHVEYDIISSFIPHFNGKPSLVNHFIAQCRLADTLTRPEDKTLLLAIIRNRMQHRVYRGIVGDDDPKTVEELIALIKSTFARSFDLNNTQNELNAVYRRESETVEEYGFRVNDILDRGVQAAKEDLNSEKFVEVKKLLMASAVTEFLRGLQNDVVANTLSKDDIKELRMAIKLSSKLEKHINSSRTSRSANAFDINPRVLTAEVRKKTCFSCGKTGHFSRECYARPDRQRGRAIRNALRCRECGKLGHTDLSCRRRNTNRVWRKSRSPVSFNF